MKKPLQLLASIFLCQMAGAIGAIFTSSAIPVWYQTLNKPWFNPPSWIFGPVWTILYCLMGLSLYLIWVNHSKSKQKVLLFFFVQLLLNAIWSPIFFGLQSPLGGLIVIIPLWVFIGLTIIYSHKISKTAAALLAPYLLWVSFASVLNFSIWQLNP